MRFLGKGPEMEKCEMSECDGKLTPSRKRLQVSAQEVIRTMLL